MPLLLTSTGLSNTQTVAVFHDLLRREPAEATVVFITLASRTHEEWEYVKKSYHELLDQGIHDEHIITVKNGSPNPTLPDKPDVIYICGGNTFYLAQQLHERRLWDYVIKNVHEGSLYVGVSAGSVLAGPRIYSDLYGDPNDCGLEDTRGLGFVQETIWPHYLPSEEQEVKRWERNLGIHIQCLSDKDFVLSREK